MNRIDLTGRKAIVTGASGGLGAAIGARLRESGAAVANLDRTPPAAESADLFCACDVTDAAAVEAAVRRFEAFGRLDILVNNAGIAAEVAPVTAASLEAWRQVIEVNLTGAFICCRAAVPHMTARGYGRVVNIASLRGREAPALSGAYAASKAGLMALTRTLAKEVATQGVLVNCVAPTAFEGGMSDGDDLAEGAEARAAIIARIPLARYGRPEELAAMVAWLASEDCSFSTGAVFDLTGGRGAW
jgi:3-oxoacyl-[acyl-carrier protein] reductase